MIGHSSHKGSSPTGREQRRCHRVVGTSVEVANKGLSPTDGKELGVAVAADGVEYGYLSEEDVAHGKVAVMWLHPPACTASMYTSSVRATQGTARLRRVSLYDMRWQVQGAVIEAPLTVALSGVAVQLPVKPAGAASKAQLALALAWQPALDCAQHPS